MADGQLIRLTWGSGLDRTTGLAAVDATGFRDIRNVTPLEGRGRMRKGILEAFAYTDSGTVTSVLLLARRRIDRTNLALYYSDRTPSPSVVLLRHTIIGVVLFDTRTPAGTETYTQAEVNGQSFIATNTNGAIATRYFDGATVTALQANLDGAGVANVCFKGVTEHLGYLAGWGFASASDPSRPEVIRLSLPGQPTVFNPEHYFLAGAKGEAVQTCLTLGRYLMVLKEGGLYRIEGNSRANFGIFSADTNFGVAGPGLAVVVNGALYYWSPFGPRVSTGGESAPIGLPLNLPEPEPGDLVARGPNYSAFALYVPGPERIHFVFGRRAYVLHLRDPQRPRWTYDEYASDLRCGGLWYGGDPSVEDYLAPHVGQKTANKVGLLYGATHQDLGGAVVGYAESEPVAPAGIDGECVFKTIYLTVTHTMAVTLRLTPFIDGVTQPTHDVALVAKGTATTETFEIGLTLAGGTAIPIKVQPRGARFRLGIQTLVSGTPAIATGDLDFDQTAIEYEVVRESRVTQ